MVSVSSNYVFATCHAIVHFYTIHVTNKTTTLPRYRICLELCMDITKLSISGISSHYGQWSRHTCRECTDAVFMVS